MSKKVKNTKQQYEWTANDNGDNVEFVAENVRFAFTRNGKSLFEPETFKKSTKFKGSFIIEEDDTLEQVKEVITYLVKNNVDEDFEFPDDFDGSIDDLEHVFLRVGNNNTNKEGEVYDGFADKFFLAATRPEKQGPPSVFADTEEEITEFPDTRVFKDGCYGNLAVRAYYSNEWDMLGLTIEAVIYTDEGEAFTADSSYSTNDDKKKKLFGSHKKKESKAGKAFGKKKDKKKKKKDSDE